MAQSLLLCIMSLLSFCLPFLTDIFLFAEIQTRVHSVGVCGTDIHYWKSGRLFDQPLPSPMVLGHETAAEVIKVGEGVTEFKAGSQICLKYPDRWIAYKMRLFSCSALHI